MVFPISALAPFKSYLTSSLERFPVVTNKVLFFTKYIVPSEV